MVVCDCVEDMSFAFAIDRNNDERIDRANYPTDTGNIIWAADVDNDGRLDTNLDTDNTGTIDQVDDKDGDGVITNGDGPLGGNVLPRKIRAVRIWLLARAMRADSSYINGHTYQVGFKTITPNDNFRRLLLSTTVTLRNRERLPMNN